MNPLSAISQTKVSHGIAMKYCRQLPGLIVVVLLMMATPAAGQDTCAAAKNTAKTQKTASKEKPRTVQKVRVFAELLKTVGKPGDHPVG